MSSEQEEIQKKIAELQKRTEEFQAGKMYAPESRFSSISSNPKLKLILVAVGVVLIITTSIYFAVRSSGVNSKKPPTAVLEQMKRAPAINK